MFYEEELDVPLVVFDEVLEHVLRIDRVLRQPMGHLLLAGDSGAGKTVLVRFDSTNILCYDDGYEGTHIFIATSLSFASRNLLAG